MKDENRELCFVMMPFTTPESYNDEKHFDKIYEQIFEPAIRNAGYEPYRVDQNKICDSIIGKIFEAVRECPMAICDLSSKNPNVLYELGLRQAYNKPVVLVQDDVTERIFDVSGISTVTYKNHRLVENVEEAINIISEAIIQTKNGQNKTLASIIKAQDADYESITVGENDKLQIALNTILNDVKELKEQQRKWAYEPLRVKKNASIYHNFMKLRLREGMSYKECSIILNKYSDVIESTKRMGDILTIEFKEIPENDLTLCKNVLYRELAGD